MKRVEGKVAVVTGAARGQGRSHALQLAEEGADIIAIDICRPIEGAEPTASSEDLAETVRLVEERGRRIIGREVDVRDSAGLDLALRDGTEELGRLDIVVANAAIVLTGITQASEVSEQDWQTMIGVNLTGVWLTCRASIPHLSNGGSIILTSSAVAVGLRGTPGIAAYVSAKHGVLGLMKCLAQELGERRIRVNAINPGMVNTDMIHNEFVYRAFCPDIAVPTRDDFAPESAARTSLMGVPWLEPWDISRMVLFLASEDGRYVTGACFSIDAGMAAV